MLRDLRSLITSAQERVARQVNQELVALYWTMGKRIREDILGAKRAEYGQRVISAIGLSLSAEFGDGYSDKNLCRMIQFAERIPDRTIVATLSRQLAWSHFKEILPIEDGLTIARSCL